MKRRVFASQLWSTGLMGIGFVFPFGVSLKQAHAQTLKNTDRTLTSQETASALTVFRSPSCGCCGAWVDHMEANGFRVQVRMAENMDAIKQQYGIPEGLTACHTGVLEGYFLEGHVPAKDVQRLLLERPKVAGLTVPGMPMGSPGMEQSGEIEPYTVFTFTQSGEIAPFAR